MKTYLLLLLAALSLTPRAWATPAPAPASLPLPTIKNPFALVNSVVDGLPSGANLDRAGLKPLLGADAAAYLDLLKVDRATSQDGKITILLEAPYDGRTAKGTRVQVERIVTFTVSKDSAGRVTIDQITGIKVRPLLILGWMPVKKITIENDTTGTTTFTALLDTIFGLISHKAKVDQNGKPLP